MSVVSSAEFNGLLLTSLKAGPAMEHKLAARLGDYIQEKIREAGNARKIFDVQTVTPEQCVTSTQHDELEYHMPLEPQTVAVSSDIKGGPPNTWMGGKRFPIRFRKYQTHSLRKNETELLAHHEPFLKIIEQNSLKDLQEVEDLFFIEIVKASIWLATLRLNNSPAASGGLLDIPGAVGDEGTYVDNFFANATPSSSNIFLSNSPALFRDTLTELKQMIHNRELEIRVFLMHVSNFDDTLRWFSSEVGLTTADKITTEGYKWATIGGIEYVTTIKGNLRYVRPGHIYGFANKEALGKFLILEGVQFYINKWRDEVELWAKETVGMGIGNVNACALLLLSGSAPVDFPVPTQSHPAQVIRIYANLTTRPDPTDATQ